MNRLFISQPLHTEAFLTLSFEQNHYLQHVLRCKPGELIAIFNGKDGLWEGQIEFYKKEVKVRLTTCLKPQPKERSSFTLFFSLIKRQNWLLEKATELGVTHFQPLITQRSTMRTLCLQRHEKIIQEASEQCQRLDIPKLSPPELLTQCVQKIDKDQRIGVLDLSAQVGPWPSITGVFVGPEGGWSAQEKTVFSAHPACVPIGLGPRILRAETAGIMAASLACYFENI